MRCLARVAIPDDLSEHRVSLAALVEPQDADAEALLRLPSMKMEGTFISISKSGGSPNVSVLIDSAPRGSEALELLQKMIDANPATTQ